MGMDFKRKLPIPMETKEMFPLTEDLRSVVAKRNEEIGKVFSGQDDRLVLIIGPCSADRADSVCDYVTRLARVGDEVKEKILIIPRVYTSKPRTVLQGYMGMLHQPDPLNEPDIFKGLTATRELHLRILCETGYNCADELLYPEDYRYFDDILGYVAVGARSVEDQQHRFVAGGISVPVGMKNPVGGDLYPLVCSISAARQGHTFIYRGWEVQSTGNPLAHAVLRGGYDSRTGHSPNFSPEFVRAYRDMWKSNFDDAVPPVIIDTNHSNSGKNAELQPGVIRQVLKDRKADKACGSLIRGFMVESYLVPGCQPPSGGVYGRSITDPCLGWEETESLIREIADSI